jgi:hypothetical protein
VPPTPLTEEDIWFQIGHVHEQQKDVRKYKSAIDALFLQSGSTIMPNQLMGVCLIGIQIMPKSFSSLAGCITNKATVSAARSVQLNIWKSLLALVRFRHSD